MAAQKKEQAAQKEAQALLESNPLMRFMTTTPFQKLEPVKNWCEEHKTTLQWGAAVGAVAIAAKLLKENKKLVDEGKAMGLPFLDEKAKVTRLATVGGTYAIVYGLSNMLLKPDKEGEGLKEAVTEAEKLAEKHPRWAKRAEEVLPTAVSILIAYAMIEKPEWVERTFESSNEILNRIKSGFDFAMDWILDKSGIDDEQAKKICICLGVAIALVFLYKGAQKKEELSKMAEKFVDFSINAAKKLAPPVFASLAAVLVYTNLWPEEVMDALEAEYTEVEPEEPEKTPKKPAKKTNGRGRRKKKESNSTEATAAGVEASEAEVTDEVTEEATEAADESEAE